MPSNEVPGTSASVSHGQKRKDNSDHQNESNYGKRLREQSPFYANNTKQTRTPTRDLQKNDESNTAHMTNEQVYFLIIFLQFKKFISNNYLGKSHSFG